MDLIIKNGKIIDEKGNYKIVDIVVDNSKIKFIGKIKNYNSKEVIDAKGLFLVSGFIDVHSHGDFVLTQKTPFLAKVSQGITTEVIGNCGISGAPYTKTTISFIKDYFPIIGKKGKCPYWYSWENYIKILEESPLTTNIIPLVGHGNLRSIVCGLTDIKIRDTELKKMGEILSEIMKQGCWGLSTGLIYAPGIFSETEEIVYLAKIVSRFNGIYSTHIRGEGKNLIESVKESIEIGEKANVSLEISHLKASGKENWSKTEKVISLICKNRERGLNLNYDLYPYTASSTTITVLLPPWVREGGNKDILEKLKSSSIRRKIKKEILSNKNDWEDSVWDRIILNQVNSKKNRWMEGLSIKKISEILSKSETDFLFDIIQEERGHVNIISFTMSENSLKKFLKEKISFIGTDGLPGRRPHPRLYGSFPRVIRKYVKEEKLIDLKEAIYKMNTGPARKFGIKKRGEIKEGFFADIVIFDLNEIKDCANYKNPTLFSKGIRYVIVNGEIVFNNGKFTGKTPGKVLLKE